MKGLWTVLAFLLVSPGMGVAQEEPADNGAADGRKEFFDGLLSQGRSLAERGFYYEASVAFNGILERGE
ncbi:MAG: hypothetical protein FJ098_11870, partial [Deltaproteobacteria bacterium]|nr:hypothetical protein [Deltaproteobacteria bacterium]